MPKDLTIDEVTFQPKDVNDSVSFFMENLREGIILVVITVLIGMGLRNAIVVSAVIPISIAMSFLVMYVLGIKVQQMSTTALIIALGILVDDAIVIGDVIQVGIDEGMSGDEAAFSGIKKLFVPVFTSTLIIVGAFFAVTHNTWSSGGIFKNFTSSSNDMCNLFLSFSFTCNSSNVFLSF